MSKYSVLPRTRLGWVGPACAIADVIAYFVLQGRITTHQAGQLEDFIGGALVIVVFLASVAASALALLTEGERSLVSVLPLIGAILLLTLAIGAMIVGVP